MKKTIAAAIAAVLLILLLCSTALSENEQTGLQLIALNVGKADCLLLRDRQYTYMIDTGRKHHYGEISAALTVMGIDRLDGVFITHSDKDHVGGLNGLTSGFVAVDGWYAPAIFTEPKSEKKHPLAQALAPFGLQPQWVEAGDEFPLAEGIIRVLGPIERNTEKDDNNSLVLYAETADGTMLLCGDMEFPEERSLIDAGLIPRADVIKVGNHADDDACSDELIALVKPKAAVISTSSEEKPSTPCKRILQALKKQGTQIALTQTTARGVRVTLKNGVAEVESNDEYDLPPMQQGAAITDKSTAQDTVCIANHGTQKLDLSGWYLYSGTGGEVFVFPENTILPTGKEITVSALDSGSAGDFVWQDTKVWNKKKSDSAYLFDRYGRLTAKLE